jgi:hypothetical protein
MALPWLICEDRHDAGTWGYNPPFIAVYFSLAMNPAIRYKRAQVICSSLPAVWDFFILDADIHSETQTRTPVKQNP